MAATLPPIRMFRFFGVCSIYPYSPPLSSVVSYDIWDFFANFFPASIRDWHGKRDGDKSVGVLKSHLEMRKSIPRIVCIVIFRLSYSYTVVGYILGDYVFRLGHLVALQ